jgi:hypothetical protein
MKNYCKFYIKGKCNRDDCKFIHEDNICRDNFFKKCSLGDNCKFTHVKNNIKKKNTESFKPSYESPDLNIVLYNKNMKYTEKDVILAPNLFTEENEYEIYYKLLDEIKNTNKESEIWKLWHGDTHLIADDHISWKQICPTFNYVIETIKNTFGMDIKATRLNYYRNSSDFKPYHFDAAAIDPKKAAIQNLTIGVSFGCNRIVGFEHDKSRTKIFIPLNNCMTYGFAKDVNIEWRHGIPPEKEPNEFGRISIIAWGYVDLEKY